MKQKNGIVFILFDILWIQFNASSSFIAQTKNNNNERKNYLYPPC